jgi:hypothetical protein
MHSYGFGAGNELLMLFATGKGSAGGGFTFDGFFMLSCFACLADAVTLLLYFPALAFFGTFLLAGRLPWDDGGPPAGDRFISSSKYLLFASSAATLSRDWMMAKVK